MQTFFKITTTPVSQMKDWFSNVNSDNTEVQFNDYYSGFILTLAMKIKDKTYQMSDVNLKSDLYEFISQFDDDDKITFIDLETNTVWVTESMRLPKNGRDLVLMLEVVEN